MNLAKEITELARAARKARIGTINQLHVAGELLTRGECTFISMSNSSGVNLEGIAFACAGMVTNGVIKVTACKEAIGYSIARLTPEAAAILKEFLLAPTVPPLRTKQITNLPQEKSPSMTFTR